MSKKDELSRVSLLTLVLNRALSYNDIEYLMDYWYGFYEEPIKYSNLADIVNKELDKIHKSE